MTEDNQPWWWPERVDAEYFARLREDYPEETAGMSDTQLLEEFNEGWDQFADLWDHLGDARAQHEKLAAAFLQLVEETGKKPEDFL